MCPEQRCISVVVAANFTSLNYKFPAVVQVTYVCKFVDG